MQPPKTQREKAIYTIYEILFGNRTEYEWMKTSPVLVNKFRIEKHMFDNIRRTDMDETARHAAMTGFVTYLTVLWDYTKPDNIFEQSEELFAFLYKNLHLYDSGNVQGQTEETQTNQKGAEQA